MPVRTTHSNQPYLYYITFTCYNWLPLFQLVNAYDVVYKWFNYLQTEKNIKTTAYVPKAFGMPNHLHGILFLPTPDCSLNKIISNAKRFMAYEIIRRLKEHNQTGILQQLQSAVTDKEKKKGQLHKVYRKF